MLKWEGSCNEEVHIEYKGAPGLESWIPTWLVSLADGWGFFFLPLEKRALEHQIGTITILL